MMTEGFVWRRAACFSGAIAALGAMLMAGCAVEGAGQGATPGAAIASSDRSVTLAAAGERTGIVESTPLAVIDESAMRQRLLAAPRPPEIVVQGLGDIPEALTYADRAAATEPVKVRGGRWREAAQIGLLFGAPEGKAFLSAPQGRALVRGEPAESCPVLQVAAASTDHEATEGALRACLASLNDRQDCGCRVIARGDRLLAPHKEFGYAIGVAGRLIDPDTGADALVAAEERMIEGGGEARRLWLLGPSGPIGMLQIGANERAALVMNESGKRYDGRHKADGFRRGRVVRRAYLEDDAGKRLVVLIGYEDSELKENRAALASWNPNGPLELKQAAAE